MLIMGREDCLKHDLHVHSVQSACGLHTVLEIMEIARKKEISTVNICDHGIAMGRVMNFGVIADKRRTPKHFEFEDQNSVTLLVGIEANILDEGESDLPEGWKTEPKLNFDLISAGFHSCAKKLRAMKNQASNFDALKRFLEHYPLDILTHPCIKPFPLPIEKLVELAVERGFALEVNNANLTLNKTDRSRLIEMITIGMERGAHLVCNSDGHTFFEIGECGSARRLIEDELRLDMVEVFPINFKDESLNRFMEERHQVRKI